MDLTDMVIMPGADYKDACDAVRKKTGGTDAIKSGDLGAKILAIPTGVQLPSLSDPAVAGDIASGKETIDEDGNVLTGTVREVPSGGYDTFNMSIIDDNHLVQGSLSRIFLYSSPLNADVLFRSGSEVGLYIKQENFGDATADDVRAGKTFTSKAGLKVTGTAEF